MNDASCLAIIGVLVAALLASPFMVWAMAVANERGRRKRRRRPKK